MVSASRRSIFCALFAAVLLLATLPRPAEAFSITQLSQNAFDSLAPFRALAAELFPTIPHKVVAVEPKTVVAQAAGALPVALPAPTASVPPARTPVLGSSLNIELLKQDIVSQVLQALQSTQAPSVQNSLPSLRPAREEVLSLITRQSDSDADRRGSLFASLTNGATFTNASISGSTGSFESLHASSLTIDSTGNTSSTLSLQSNNSDGVPVLAVRDDGFVGIGTDAPLGQLYVDMTALSYGEAPTPATAAPASGLVPPNGGVVVAANTHGAPITGVSANNVSVGSGLYLRSVRARGTLDTPLAVQAGDIMLDMAADAWDGNSRVGDIARILFLADGTIADGRVPTAITFDTSTDATPSVTAERMRITPAGDVGIGTTNPRTRFQVSSAVATAPVSAVVPGGAEISAVDDSSAVLLGVGASSVAAVPGAYFRSVRARGTVASPTVVQADDVLSIWGAEGYDGASRAAAAQINMEVDTTPGSSDMPGRISFWTTPDGSSGSLERMRITNAGRLGIGTTNPGQQLTVAQGVAFLGVANGAGTAYLCQTLATGVVSTSTGTCTASSARYKDNIQNLSYGLSDVLKLRAVSFDYKPELLVPGHQVGFIAEEVDQVVPEVVGHDAEGRPDSVDYPKITPLLVKAIQELNSRIDAISGAATDLILESMSSHVVYTQELNADRVNAQELRIKGEDGSMHCVKIDNVGELYTTVCDDTAEAPPPTSEDQ